MALIPIQIPVQYRLADVLGSDVLWLKMGEARTITRVEAQETLVMISEISGTVTAIVFFEINV